MRFDGRILLIFDFVEMKVISELEKAKEDHRIRIKIVSVTDAN